MIGQESGKSPQRVGWEVGSSKKKTVVSVLALFSFIYIPNVTILYDIMLKKMKL